MEKIKYLHYSCKVKMDQEASQPTGRKSKQKTDENALLFKKLQIAVESHYLRIL